MSVPVSQFSSAISMSAEMRQTHAICTTREAAVLHVILVTKWVMPQVTNVV